MPSNALSLAAGIRVVNELVKRGKFVLQGNLCGFRGVVAVFPESCFYPGSRAANGVRLARGACAVRRFTNS